MHGPVSVTGNFYTINAGALSYHVTMRRMPGSTNGIGRDGVLHNSFAT